MAKELEPKEGGPEPDGDDEEGNIGSATGELPEGTEAPEPESAPEPDDAGSSPGGAPQRRKRKRRS